MTIEISILGVGLLGPGLNDWATGQALLRDPTLWHSAATVVPAPTRLPATERRRAGVGVKASIVVADQAVAQAATQGGLGTGQDSGQETSQSSGVETGPETGLETGLRANLEAAALATVFTSSTGDTHNCHQMCEALAAPQRSVSPTRFTNSVHNAPAGYWHIAAQSRAPSTSLAALDASFAAGLLEAAVQCHTSGQPVLLVACDQPYPEPLHALRPVPDVFATALLIGPPGLGRRLLLSVAPDALPSVCNHAGLEALRQGIPAARALPLLQALAQLGASSVVIDGAGQPSLRVQLT